MERTKKAGEVSLTEQKPTWRKIGGGSLRIGNRIIKPGQSFEAWPDEIRPAFRNLVIPLSGDANFNLEREKEASPVVGVKPVYELQPHGKSLFLFDIVTETGKDEKGEPIYKILNEKSLKKEVAENLLKDLQR